MTAEMSLELVANYTISLAVILGTYHTFTLRTTTARICVVFTVSLGKTLDFE